MKILSIESPGRIALGEASRPRVGSGEVLLKIKRVGFCGSDLNTFRGSNPLVTYPRIPGHEIAGKIVERGSEVPDSLTLGMTVTALPYTSCGKCSACRIGRSNACRDNQTLGVQRDGAFAEFIALPWERIIVAPTLGELELALVEPLSVGFHAIDRGRVSEKDTVLIFGCGMIGLGAIAAAGLDRGSRVIAVDVDDAKLQLAKTCGAFHTVNSHSENLDEKLRDLTEGHGADVVIEAVGLPQTFQSAVRLVSFAGRVVYIGYAKEPVSYETKYFIMKELDIMGSRNATKKDFLSVVRLLESGRYPATQTVTQTVTHTVTLADGPHALEEWARHPTAVTKIHVTF